MSLRVLLALLVAAFGGAVKSEDFGEPRGDEWSDSRGAAAHLVWLGWIATRCCLGVGQPSAPPRTRRRTPYSFENLAH